LCFGREIQHGNYAGCVVSGISLSCSFKYNRLTTYPLRLLTLRLLPYHGTDLNGFINLSGLNPVFLYRLKMVAQYNTYNIAPDDYSLPHIVIHKSVIPAGIHVRLSCLSPFGLMQICSRQICAGIQTTWKYLSSPSMALDTRFPAGMTRNLYICV